MRIKRGTKEGRELIVKRSDHVYSSFVIVKRSDQAYSPLVIAKRSEGVNGPTRSLCPSNLCANVETPRRKEGGEEEEGNLKREPLGFCMATSAPSRLCDKIPSAPGLSTEIWRTQRRRILVLDRAKGTPHPPCGHLLPGRNRGEGPKGRAAPFGDRSRFAANVPRRKVAWSH